MRIAILTSSELGTASHHLPYLLKSDEFEIAKVIICHGKPVNRKKHFRRKLKKVLKIGIWGTLNGIKTRPWFSDDVHSLLQISSIKKQCKQAGIPCTETEVLNSNATATQLADANADLAISLGNAFIAPRIFNIPKLGMINIHHEILPDYQNAQSVIWQLYNMSAETGFTIHQVDRKIDTGAILYQEKTPIIFKESLADTVTYTIAQLWELSATGLVKVLENFSDYQKSATLQGEGRHYTTPSYSQFKRIKRNYNRLKSAQLINPRQ